MNARETLPGVLVDTAQGLVEAVAACRSVEYVALDTEFMRVRTFYAQPALFQLCDGRRCYLVDPLVVEDLAPLAELLADTRVTKLMHSCSEDLEVCDRRLGVLPEPLIDTQVVAAFCGLGLSMGYQRAIAEVLGIALEKSETRTDWLQRPLSAAQLHYAAEDVAHLGALHHALSARLAERPERVAWAQEECAALLVRYRARDTALDYRAVGGAWRLDRRGLAVLRALHAWREGSARARDLPRNWIVPDAALLRLAEQQPLAEDALAAVPDLPPAVVRRFGKVLIAEIAAARALPESALPESVPAPAGPAESRLVKRLREAVVQRAQSWGVAPEMLARRRELEEIVRCAGDGLALPAIAPLLGWRRAVIGEELWRLAGGAA